MTHPSVTNDPEHVKSRIGIYKDAYSATKGTHAIVLCTEWDEFVVSNNLYCVLFVKSFKGNFEPLIILIFFFIQELDYKRIYINMMKPAYIFDGRKILDHGKLQKIGFIVQTIGKRITRTVLSRAWGSQTQI